MNIIIKEKKHYTYRSIIIGVETKATYKLQLIKNLELKPKCEAGIKLFKEIYINLLNQAINKIDLIDVETLGSIGYIGTYDINNVYATALDVLFNTDQELYIASVDTIEDIDLQNRLNSSFLDNCQDQYRIVHNGYDNLMIASERSK